MANKKTTEQRNASAITALGVIVLLLLGVLVASICMRGFTDADPFGLFKKDEKEDGAPEEVLIFDYDDNEYLKIAALTLPIAAPGSEQTVKLTATVQPDNAIDKTVDWDLKWQNDSSDFASGKNLSDYSVLTPESDGSLMATLYVKQAFGEPLIITCTSRVNKEAKATCIVNYVKRVEIESIEFKRPSDPHADRWNNEMQTAVDILSAQYTDVIVKCKSGLGTVDPNITITVKLDDSAFYNKMREILKKATGSSATGPAFQLWAAFKNTPEAFTQSKYAPVSDNTYKVEYVPFFADEFTINYTGSSMSNNWNYGYACGSYANNAQTYFYKQYFENSYVFFQKNDASAQLRNKMAEILNQNMSEFDNLSITLEISVNATYKGKDFSPQVKTLKMECNYTNCKYKLTKFLEAIALGTTSGVTLMDSELFV